MGTLVRNRFTVNFCRSVTAQLTTSSSKKTNTWRKFFYNFLFFYCNDFRLNQSADGHIQEGQEEKQKKRRGCSRLK